MHFSHLILTRQWYTEAYGSTMTVNILYSHFVFPILYCLNAILHSIFFISVYFARISVPVSILVSWRSTQIYREHVICLPNNWLMFFYLQGSLALGMHFVATLISVDWTYSLYHCFLPSHIYFVVQGRLHHWGASLAQLDNCLKTLSFYPYLLNSSFWYKVQLMIIILQGNHPWFLSDR